MDIRVENPEGARVQTYTQPRMNIKDKSPLKDSVLLGTFNKTAYSGFFNGEIKLISESGNSKQHGSVQRNEVNIKLPNQTKLKPYYSRSSQVSPTGKLPPIKREKKNPQIFNQTVDFRDIIDNQSKQSYGSPMNMTASTMSSLVNQYGWKGRDVNFTQGFMNLMYRDHSLLQASRSKNLNSVRLKKLKEMEELQRKREQEYKEKLELADYYLQHHQIQCDANTLKLKSKQDLIVLFETQVFTNFQNRSATIIQTAYRNHRQRILDRERMESAKKIQAGFRLYIKQKIEKAEQAKRKLRAALTIASYWRGQLVRNIYEPELNRKKLQKNFVYFDQLKNRVEESAQILIRYHWFSYKKRKAKRRKQQNVRKQNNQRPKMDSGMSHYNRKATQVPQKINPVSNHHVTAEPASPSINKMKSKRDNNLSAATTTTDDDSMSRNAGVRTSQEKKDGSQDSPGNADKKGSKNGIHKQPTKATSFKKTTGFKIKNVKLTQPSLSENLGQIIKMVKNEMDGQTKPSIEQTELKNQIKLSPVNEEKKNANYGVNKSPSPNTKKNQSFAQAQKISFQSSESDSKSNIMQDNKSALDNIVEMSVDENSESEQDQSQTPENTNLDENAVYEERESGELRQNDETPYLSDEA